MIIHQPGLGSHHVRGHRRAGLRPDRKDQRFFFGALAALFTSVFAEAGAGIGSAIGATDAVGAAIGTGLEGATIGAGVGAAGAGLTGGNPLTGALTGGLTGGAVGGLGSAIGGELGIGTAGGDILAGAGAGALGAGLTGGNPLTGGALGAASGGVASLIGGSGGGAAGGGSAGAVNAPGVSAGGVAAPAAVGADLPLQGPTISGDTLSGPAFSGGGAGSDSLSLSSTSTPAASVNAGATNGYTVADVTPWGAPAGSPTLPSGSPIPPVPPALDASGQPIFNAAGESVYPTADAASAAGTQQAASTAGFKTGTGLFGGGPTTEANASGITGALNNFLGTNFSTGNIATGGLAAATLGYDALKGGTTPKGLNAISGEATQLGAQSTQLESYLTTGTLPPGVQTSLNQAAAAAQASIRSQYASRGLSGSSAEATDLANVQNTIASQGATIAQNLLTTGVNEAGLASQLYSQIMQQSLQSDQQLGTALSTLAGAAARPTITLNTASG